MVVIMNTRESPPDRAQRSAMQVGHLTSIKILAVGALGLLLYVAHVAFIPVALALLAALILSGPVEALHKLHIPRSISAIIILVIVLGATAEVVDLMWAPTQQWYAAAPQTIKVIKRKLNPALKFLTHVEELRSTAGSLAATGQTTAAAVVAPAEKESAPELIFEATREVMVSTLTFVIITLFLLAGGPPMLARMTAAFVDDLNSAHVLDIIEKVRGEVGRFYVTTGVVNLGLGCATAGAMALCGMPTPYIWGIMAAVFNFIPYAGSAATFAMLTLVAFVTFDGMGRVLAVAGSYLVLAVLEGQIVQPLFVGRRMRINPLLIFLGLWFGGLFWGIAGVILATPALLTLKVVAENATRGKSVMEFMGPNNQTTEGEKILKKLRRPAARG
jgi:predicted PurR-regulated permease PerM